MKRNWTRILGTVALLLFAGACVLFFSLREKQGYVESIAQLPIYGSDLPAGIRTERVKYLYYPGTKGLLAVTDVPPGEFMKMCNHFGVEPLSYPKGFQDGVVTNVQYAPTNGYVYLAERKMYPDGRATLRLYLQPSEESRQAGGKLFIQVLN